MTLAPEITTRTLTFTRTIHAAAQTVYEAFLTRDTLFYWLADDANVNARVGGHILLIWDNGANYAFGSFTALEPNQHLSFTLNELNNPEVDVDVNVEESSGNVVIIRLSVSGDLNDDTAARLDKEWNRRMDNLASFIETGADLRVTRRVIIGIYPDNLDENAAKRLGVPVSEGTRVTGVIEGYSAQAAGLQVDDVIVSLAGQTVDRNTPMFRIVGDNQPGDNVEVGYYRGSEKRAATMTLKGYPVPPMAADFKGLADATEKIFNEVEAELHAALAGVSEADASKKPAPEEWSAKEVMAHLILAERWRQHWLGGLIQRPEVTGYTANATARLAGLMAVYPTLNDLTAELHRGFQETLALLRAFPAEAHERRSNLWWVTFELAGMPPHTRGHIEQIKAAVAAARAA